MIDRLVKTYNQPLYRYLRRMLRNSEDAKDVLQNTWLQVCTHIGELREQSSERAYLYRVATNCAYMWLRNEHPSESIDGVDESVLQSLHSEPEIEPGQELLARLEQTILRLPPTQRAIFNLRYHEDMSYEEIAQITQSTIGAAKTNYSLAKRKISGWMTAMVSSVLLVLTLGIAWGQYENQSATAEIVYASDDWAEFANDDLFLE